ncbi:MAG: type I secretion protein [Alphaproteobacteria bacterium HGW-Alphaproteobacteria-2]|nr:MAG: type I secretion protein [Alphaproteobacteria bacterium HGW-Alphaproteobacteria-2]
MPQTYLDQFFLIDPANPPAVGSALTVTKLTMTDQNDDNDFDRFNNDSVNGSDIISSWPGDRVTVNVPGVGNVTYTGITFYLANGQRVFTPTDGQALESGTFVRSTFVNTQGPLLLSQLGPPCFTIGTLIDTPEGPMPVEVLRPGMAVTTRDHGAQPLRWIGRQLHRAAGAFAPVRFMAGALGNTRDLLVSQQHRMLITGWRAELLFGEPEVLAPARHLVNGDTIHLQPGGEVEYFHLLFDRHEIVTAEGIPSESFYPLGPGAEADRAIQAELHTLFPGFSRTDMHSRWQLARPVLRAHEARLLMA